MAMFLRLLASGLWSIIWPALQPLLTKSGRACMALAKEYVVQAMTRDGWTDKEKAEWVAQRIKESDGSFSDSLINRCIELVIPHVKANLSSLTGQTLGKLIR